MGQITIRITGGVLDAAHVPAGCVLVVRDYDVDGVDEDALLTDASGDQYYEAVWLPEDSNLEDH